MRVNLEPLLAAVDIRTLGPALHGDARPLRDPPLSERRYQLEPTRVSHGELIADVNAAPAEDAANVTIAEPLRTQKANAVPASFAGIRDTSYARSVFLNSLPYQPRPVPLTQVLTTVMSVRCGLGRKPLVRRFNSDRGLHLIRFLSIKSETRLSSISSVMSGR